LAYDVGVERCAEACELYQQSIEISIALFGPGFTGTQSSWVERGDPAGQRSAWRVGAGLDFDYRGLIHCYRRLHRHWEATALELKLQAGGDARLPCCLRLDVGGVLAGFIKLFV
jgi:hypothetical protein